MPVHPPLRRSRGRRSWRSLLATFCMGGATLAAAPAVGPVPTGVRAAFDLDPFYTQHLDVGGLPVLASDRVAPAALHEAAHLIRSMLATRPDLLATMRDLRFRCAVMAPDEYTTDIPEHRDLTPRDYWDRRARGLGPTRQRPAVSCGEENLLQYPGDPYPKENILVHEFAHAIHEAVRVAEPDFDARLAAVHQSAREAGRWQDTYALTNPYEFWAEAVQSYFDNNRESDRAHNHVNTRAELAAYDPDLHALVDGVFRGNPWRYVYPRERDESGHLAGLGAEPARRFAWPARLAQATPSGDGARDYAEPERVEQDVAGWTVRVDTQLLEGRYAELGEAALTALAAKLREIVVVVPAQPLARLQGVTLVLDREHPRFTSMQYHPSAGWLREHGHNPELVRCVHLPRAETLVGRHAAHQQPWAVLHELAHAYHDQVLGFEEPRILAAWETFRAQLEPPEVLHISGRRRPHYALTDQKEFFAEMTEAYFGTNDFHPFVRAELLRDYPAVHALLAAIWGPIPYP